MQKSSYKNFVACILILILGLFSYNSEGQVTSLKKSKADLTQDILDLNNKIKKLDKDKTSRLKYIDLLNKKIKSREALINVYKSENKNLSNQIVVISDSIEIIEENIITIRKNFTELLRAFQIQQSTTNSWLFILDAKNMQEAYKRYNYLKQYSDYRKHQTSELKEKSALLSKSKKALNSKKQAKKIVENQTIQQAKDLLSDKNEVNSFVKNLDSQKQDLLAQIKKKKAKALAIEKEIKAALKRERELARQKALAEAAKNKAKNNNSKEVKETKVFTFAETPQGKLASKKFAGNKGKLSWPVTNGEIKHKFGPYHPKGLPNITFDVKGLEIETQLNTPVKTVFGGKISSIFLIPNGTKGVVVRHGSYVTIYANLKEVTVKEGDLVKVNTNLGKVASEDLKFGLLDFQIWIEYKDSEKNLNPSDWLRKK